MSATTIAIPHPLPDRLRAFALGQLALEEAEPIAAHLACCPACEQAVGLVPDDHLVAVVRRLTNPGDRTEAREAVRDLPPGLRDHPRYQVLARLGEGGMGVVFKARHRLMDRVVALKVISQKTLGNPSAIDRFQRETKAIARLTHPNIVTAFEAEWVGDCQVLVMEYLEGTTLKDLVAQKGQISVQEACDLISQAARGLEHAHARGLIHRDIKPSNLIRTPDGLVKILDFGLASCFTGEIGNSLTEFGCVLGTAGFLAPEQYANARDVDARADVYSLGCTLNFLLGGQGDRGLPLGTTRPDLPPDLVRVVERMLARSPEQRYQSVTEVIEALEPFVVPAARARIPLPRWTIGLAGSLVLLVGGVFAWWSRPPRDEPSRKEIHPPPAKVGSGESDPKSDETGKETPSNTGTSKIKSKKVSSDDAKPFVD